MSTQTSSTQWFALHTLSGQENKVKNYIEKFKKAEELDDQINEVLLPTEVVSEVKNGKKSVKTRKLYPGYVFINMCLYDEEKKVMIKPFYFVKDAAGVIGFVGGDHPAALRQTEIDEIKARMLRLRSARSSRSPTAPSPTSPAASTRSTRPAASSRFPSPFSVGLRL